MSTPPGWYPDPAHPTTERYWDGAAWTTAIQFRPAPPTPGRATASLVLGILSVVLCGAFTGIPAMVTGSRARREIEESRGRLGGRGLAVAGFWTGLVGTTIFLVAFLLTVAVLLSGSVRQDGADDCGNDGLAYCP